MIAKLTGLVDSLGPDWAIIDCGGVGYLVACSSQTLVLIHAGAKASLIVETQMREDRIQLYGFASSSERDWFRLLLGVQGVGGKVALAILSALNADLLTAAILSADRATLSRADGVGPKLASRLISELKDKIGGAMLGKNDAGSVGGGSLTGAGDRRIDDAVSALANLGFGRAEAFTAVSRAAAVDTASAGQASLDDLIRAGLKALAA